MLNTGFFILSYVISRVAYISIFILIILFLYSLNYKASYLYLTRLIEWIKGKFCFNEYYNWVHVLFINNKIFNESFYLKWVSGDKCGYVFFTYYIYLKFNRIFESFYLNIIMLEILHGLFGSNILFIMFYDSVFLY